MTKKSVYVAGKVGPDLLEMHMILGVIEDMGFEIAYDWTRTGDGIQKPYLDHVDTNRPFAMKMRNAADMCDIFVLLPTKNILGALIELGIAIGSTRIRPGKIIYVVCDRTDLRQSIFYTLEDVVVFDSLKELYIALAAL